jgi:hypothetical protein
MYKYIYSDICICKYIYVYIHTYTDSHLHSEVGLRTTSFAQRIVSKLWCTVIYEDLQKALSDVNKRKEDLEVFAPLLLAVSRILHMSQVSQ